VSDGVVVVFPLMPGQAADSLGQAVLFYRRTFATAPGATEPTAQAIVRPHTGWLAPSGRWTAVVYEGTLEVYGLISTDFVDVEGDPTCNDVITWSSPLAGGRERIACAADGFIRIFEVSESPPLVRVTGEIAFDGDVTGSRRGFSPSGRWLVVGDGQPEFSAFDLASEPPLLLAPSLTFAAGPVELAFPSGRDVVTLSGADSLREHAIGGGFAGSFPTAVAAPRTACSEAYWARPRSWCGAATANEHFSYAAGARTLLFQPSSRALSIAEAGVDFEARTVVERLGDCGVGCLGRAYAFQR
jgi:hypothetical protein